MLNRSPAATQRGLSLVELMVGITVGMFVVAAASTVVATQLTDNRRLMLEVQVQQDLRAAADIVTRDVRRAGSWTGNATTAGAAVWSPGSPAVLNATPAAVTISGSPPLMALSYSTARTVGTTGPYGFRVNSDGVLQTLLPSPAAGTSQWQALTDETTMRIKLFVVVAEDEPPVRVACPKLCVDNTQSCWPTVTVRSLRIQITGESRSDANVVRSVESVVRLRNDQVAFDTAVCPS